MKQQYIAYVLMCSFWAVTLGSSEDSASAGLSNEEKAQAQQLQTLFNNPQKTDDYYFKLLGIDLSDLAPLQTPENLESILKPILEQRLKLLQEIPSNLQLNISEIIHQAKNVLANPQLKNLYGTIGHNIFSNLAYGDPQALQLVLNTPSAMAPKRIIQYYSAVLNPNIPNPIAYMQNNFPVIHLPDTYNNLNTNQQKIYNALGHTAFIELSQKDLKVLEGLVRGAPEITHADIFKQRINQLLCEIAAGKPCEPKKEEKPDTKTPDGKETPTKETPGKPSEKTKDLSIEAFKTANLKLQNALHSLNTAKRYLKGIERDERAAIKKRINNDLSDYKAIKTYADDIKRNSESAHAEHRKFAQLVDKIYSVSRSF